MDVKQSQKAGNNAIQIQQTVVGDNNYVVGIEIENDSRKPNDNQPKRSLLRRLAAFLNEKMRMRQSAKRGNAQRVPILSSSKTVILTWRW